MNSIQIQLNDRQLADLTELLDEGLDAVSAKLSNEEADHYTQADRDEIMRLSCDGISEIRQAIEDRSYLWLSSSGCIDLTIPLQAIEDIAQSGSNDAAVKRWLSEPSYLKAQFDRWEFDDVDAARGYLADAGIENAEDKGDEEVAEYILWMACHDIKEERNQED